MPENLVAADEQLYAALPRRHTNRQPLRAGRPDHAVLGALGGPLSRVHDSTCSTGIDTERVVDVLHDPDRAQRLDPAIRAEVARWTHRPGDANDGLRDDDRGPTKVLLSAAASGVGLARPARRRLSHQLLAELPCPLLTLRVQLARGKALGPEAALEVVAGEGTGYRRGHQRGDPLACLLR